MGTNKISKNVCYCKGPAYYVDAEEREFDWERNYLDYRPCDYGSVVEASLANCCYLNVEPTETTHHREYHCSCVSGPNRTASFSSHDGHRNENCRTKSRSYVTDIGRYRKDNWFDCHASTRTADNCYDRYASAFSSRLGKPSILESSKRSFRNGITFSNDSSIHRQQKGLPNVYRGLKSARRDSVQYYPAAKANYINLFPYSNSAALRYQKGMPTRITGSVNTL